MPIQVKVDSGLAAETVTDALADVLSYCRQKALYEADCRVREKCGKMRAALFAHDSSKDHCTVVELARCKRKLKHLCQEVGQTPDGLKALFAPVVSELESRVAQLRVDHQKHSA